jgi:glycosyltransferase involved in cell wall biosynthesis
MVSSKKIIFLANTAESLWRFRRAIMTDLIKSGYDVACIAPPDPFVHELQKLGIRFLSLRLHRCGIHPFQELRALYDIAQHLKHEQPDVLFTYTIKPNVYGTIIAYLLKIPCVAVVTGLGYAFLNSTLRARVARFLLGRGLSAARHIWFVNQDDLNRLVKAGMTPASRSSVLPGEGLDTNYFAPRSKPANQTGLHFLMISRLLIDKGVREFLAAAKSIRQQQPTAEFHLIGPLDTGNPAALPKPELDNAIASGDIIYHGRQHDVRPMIAASDCVVLPSYGEGLPTVLLEAGAMARPVIATDVPGCRDVIIKGINGFLCTARHEQSLTDTLRLIIAMPEQDRIKMGLQAREHIKTSFDQAIILRYYHDMIQHLRAT